jgi:hypothetical protein
MNQKGIRSRLSEPISEHCKSLARSALDRSQPRDIYDHRQLRCRAHAAEVSTSLQLVLRTQDIVEAAPNTSRHRLEVSLLQNERAHWPIRLRRN